MNRPDAGVLCADCGCCLAQLFAGDDPLCWECDAGEPCRAKTQPAPAPIQVVKPTQEKKQMTKISDEVKAKILAADPSVSNLALAKQFGVSDGGVLYIRRRAGIRSTARRSQGSSKKINLPSGPSADNASARITAISKTTSTPFTVSIDLTSERADAFWSKFSLRDKAVAIHAALKAMLENA